MTGLTCRLTAPELQRRRATVLAEFRAAQLEVRDLADGFAFRFDVSATRLAALAEFINLERQCCSFLDFRLLLAADDGALWLELSGPPGTRELLRDELGFLRP